MDFELKEGTNTGVLIQEPRPTDFIAGDANISSTSISRLESGDWRPFLPDPESQNSIYFDSMACVTFSAIKSIAIHLNRLLADKVIPVETLIEMEKQGYLKNGQFNFSERFTAKLSGTTHMGNYAVSVWDSIRKDGLIPEADWAYPRGKTTPAFDWDDYYAPIPDVLKEKGKAFLKFFGISYQWLATGGGATDAQFNAWLKVGPIQILTPVCPPWNTTDMIPACGRVVSHATTMVARKDGAVIIADHYSPFEKQLSLEYSIPYALQGFITPTSSSDASVSINPAFGKKFTGKLLLAPEDRGSLWYVVPDGKRIKIGQKPEEVATFLKAVNDRKVPVTGMTNANLSKIAIIK